MINWKRCGQFNDDLNKLVDQARADGVPDQFIDETFRTTDDRIIREAQQAYERHKALCPLPEGLPPRGEPAWLQKDGEPVVHTWDWDRNDITCMRWSDHNSWIGYVATIERGDRPLCRTCRMNEEAKASWRSLDEGAVI
jgi:hypothetical protein